MTDHPFDVFALPVHPAAEEFPMLPEAELKALGADIKANGQHHPVLAGEVDRVLMVMDGRNRREACRIAGVTPDVKIITVEDPIRRIWSENGQRRNMTKGARAMVAACIFSKTEQGKRKTSLTINLNPAVSLLPG
jgi:ParB-like nuclease family protein